MATSIDNRKPVISRVGLNETGSLPSNASTAYNPTKIIRADIKDTSDKITVRQDELYTLVGKQSAMIKELSVQNTQLISILDNMSKVLEVINRQADKYYANLTIRVDKINDKLDRTYALLMQATQPEDNDAAPELQLHDIEQAVDQHIRQEQKKNNAGLDEQNSLEQIEQVLEADVEQNTQEQDEHSTEADDAEQNTQEQDEHSTEVDDSDADSDDQIEIRAPNNSA